MTSRSQLEVEAAAKLNSVLRIADIGLVEITANTLNQVEEPTWCFSTSLNEVRWYREENAILGIYPVQVFIQHKGAEEPENLALVRVAARAVYVITGELDDEKLACVPDFLGIVGWMHVWPYLRAEVQQLSAKLGYPPLTLPLLLAGQTKNIPVVSGNTDEVDTEAPSPSKHILGR